VDLDLSLLSATLIVVLCALLNVILFVIFPIFKGCISSTFKAFNNNLHCVELYRC
jgi:hypothetical protein